MITDTQGIFRLHSSLKDPYSAKFFDAFLFYY